MTVPGRRERKQGPGGLDRRQWLGWALAAGAASVLPAGCAPPPDETIEGRHDSPLPFPGKVAMRALNDRPPCLETPWAYFKHDLTPNEAFYVRWHLQFVPTRVDTATTATWRLKVGGLVERPIELSLADLRAMRPASLVAVNQCSGNSRGLVTPHVTGAQWGNGAMGNARWTGVPLADLLQKAGLKRGAVDVAFDSLDRSGFRTVADFSKSLPVEKALDSHVLVAYAMNDEPLPLLNGFPVRLVVPGWYATYWVKSLEGIRVLDRPFDGYWMSTAYRIPAGPGAAEKPGELAKTTVPIHRMNVRSFFTGPEEGAVVPARRPVPLEGIAFDGGAGIARVEVSADGGTTWQGAELGEDLGRFSFRRWRHAWQPAGRGRHRLLVRAVSRDGEAQPMEAGWNRSGYMRNVVEGLTVEAV